MNNREIESPLALYVHLPFCRVRCTYCAFAISTDQSIEDAYVDALINELKLRFPDDAGSSAIDSLYLGGGTPSRTSGENLRRLMEAIHQRLTFSPSCEITLEANPEDITHRTLDDWKALGVNRLSVGVQSLNDSELIPLGRAHGSSVALDAIHLAAQYPFRLNADLIVGLPGQSVDSFRRSLDTLLDSAIDHLSLYILDLEQGSTLESQVRSGKRLLPPDESTVEMYRLAVDRLAEANFLQYEISNFARPGCESRHNLRYWARRPYVGVGMGAHSFLGRERSANTTDIHRYIDGLGSGAVPTEFREILSEEDIRHEQIFLSLRQTAGLEYAALIGLTGEEGASWVEQGLVGGWLSQHEGRVSFTSDGFLLSNDYISQLF